jgi:NADH-quinone oxidoreductase subunit G
MPKIEIDGVTINADPGKTIIEVADSIAVPIPRFCYHRKLSVAANCRMCLVHVENSPKTLPACATPVAEGMKIWTKSKETIAAQRAVMEFLLINHPLDCPVCDQGGECELQDVSMQYGSGDSRYTEAKRVFLDHDLGSLIATEMTRCIQCTRCVRFGTEISGERELGATGRGEYMEIETFISKHMHSEVSGNIIDLCPVGALTSKPFRFKARSWELKQFSGVAAHDCIGSNIYMHTMHQKVMRVVPKDNEHLNEIWLSDRDRFSYDGLYHEERLHKPLLRKQEKWSTATWTEALKYTVAGLQLIADTYTPDRIGFLASPSHTCEEYYLLQKLARAFGCNNIDHRLRQLDFSQQESAPLYPNLGIKFADLSKQDAVLLIGSNIAKEQPLASIRLRSMVQHGGKVCVINAVDYRFNFEVAAKAILAAGVLLKSLAAVAKELISITKFNVAPEVIKQLETITIESEEKNIAALLLTGKNRQVILGQQAMMHPNATQLIALGNLIAEILDGHCGYFSEGANAAGAWLTGCIPHRAVGGAPITNPGKNALQMLQEPLNCYILYGMEPEFDSVLGAKALETLKQADFVVAFSAYQSDTLLEIADVILPISQFAEISGNIINIDGTRQNFDAAVAGFGESRAGWKVLRVLGNLAGLAGFDYNTTQEVSDELYANIELQQSLPRWQSQDLGGLELVVKTELTRLAPISLYAIDSLVRRSAPLQKTRDARLEPHVELHSMTASNLNVRHDEVVRVASDGGCVNLTVKINNAVAPYTAVVFQANKSSLELGLPFSKLEIHKAHSNPHTNTEASN